MHDNKRRSKRNIEIAAGFIILLTSFAFLGSILIDFNFVSPDTTLNEDVNFLLEHSQSQTISAFAWIATAVLTIISVPFYILTFHKRLKFYHIVISLLIVAAAAGFFLTGWLGLQFSDSINIAVSGGDGGITDGTIINMLDNFSEEQYYKRIASSCIGLFVILLAFTRFRVKTFPVISSIFFILAGPVLIFYNWYDPDHILRTSAMATIATGMIIFCIKLIYSGLSPRLKKAGVKPAASAN